MDPRKEGRGRGGHYRRGGRNRPNSNKIDIVQTPVAERQRIFSECSEDQCSICWSDVTIFAVGMCNHHVCHTCSTRMRVLCQQNECPICRQDMPKVVYTEKRCLFKDVADMVLLMDKRFRICFENDKVKKAFDDLIQHQCLLCQHEQPVFRTFKQLDSHVRREHERFFCELCSGNLKIFSHEMKLYTRSDLATHRRKGDSDDSSHKGHPLCKFCEVRYLDDDELFRHLRRDHFFCHFCDADCLQQYFQDYNLLKGHFQEEHYLCEEGDCIDEQFTHAFRTEFDLKAHKVDRHSDGLSRAEVRQNRMVDVDLTFNRPGAGAFSQHGRRQGRNNSPTPPYHSGQNVPEAEAAPISKVPDMADDFPSLLGGNAHNANRSNSSRPSNLAHRVAISSGRNVQQSSWASGVSGSSLQDQDFPSLPGSQPAMAQKPLPQYKPTKPVMGKTKAKGPDFPALQTSSASMAQFGENTTPAIHRNMTGYTPAWSSEAGSNQMLRNEGPRREPVQPQQPMSSMVTLTKQKAVAAAPDLDFPMLEAQKNPKVNPSKDLQPSKSRKNKGKKGQNGSLIGDNIVSKTSSLKGAANLKSAADLIFLDKPKLQKELQPKLQKELQPKLQVEQKPASDAPIKVTIPASGNTNGAPGFAAVAGASKTSEQKVNTNEASAFVAKAGASKISQHKANAIRAEDFPALQTTSSNRMAVQFGQHNTTGIHRNMTSYAPTWNSESGSNEMIREEESHREPPQPQYPIKQKGIAPAPDLDFPTLEAPKKPEGNPSKDSQPSKSRKIKGKTGQNGSLVGDNIDSVPKTGSGESLKSAATLKSAADLIFLEKHKGQIEVQIKMKPAVLNAPIKENIPALGNTNGPPGFAAIAGASKTSEYKASIVAPRSSMKVPPPGLDFAKGIKPAQKNQMSYNYVEPPGFSDRNGKLVSTIASVFGGGKSLDFGKFKTISNQFKMNQLSSADYIEECLALTVDERRLEKFLSELIALLPNIAKQRELMKVFGDKFPDSNIPNQLIPCETCSQLLRKSDTKSHCDSHSLDLEFPSL